MYASVRLRDKAATLPMSAMGAKADTTLNMVSFDIFAKNPRMKSKLKTVIFLNGLVAMLSSCDRRPPTPPKELPALLDSDYTVGLKTYKDGAYADQPFDLSVKAKNSDDSANIVLSADQCKNVKVVQDEEALYIFYERLGLSHFSNYSSNDNIPPPLLCDLEFEHCRQKLTSMQQEKRIISDVCSYVINENE